MNKPLKLISTATDNIFFPKKISLDISSESSAQQMSHMKCQDLFSLKTKKQIQILECHLLQISLGALRSNIICYR